MIPGTETRADHNSGTDRDPIKEVYQRIADRRRRADRSQRRCSEIVSHDNAVDCVVELLEDISHDQRDCKKNQLFPDYALCHIDIAFSAGCNF